MSKFAYIESATGIVWAASTNPFSVEDIATQTGFPVDVRRDDAPNTVEPRGSELDHYDVWNGSEYVVTWDIPKCKYEKNEQIDMRTREIIADGVAYDNRIFPLDLPDQSTWHGIFNAVAAGVASYPIKVMDKTDEPYYLNTAQEFQQMYFYGFGAVGQILESGRTLKAQVNACTTKEEIDAIVDPR
jgi:hypothetical protein